MFAWATRRLDFLKWVPGLPQAFDFLLLAQTGLCSKERLRALQEIERILMTWPGVATRLHRFGGVQFNLGRREIGHLHGNGLLDIPFPKSIRDEVVAAGRANPHHIFPQSAWVSVYLRGEADIPHALALLRLNYERWLKLDVL